MNKEEFEARTKDLARKMMNAIQSEFKEDITGDDLIVMLEATYGCHISLVTAFKKLMKPDHEHDYDLILTNEIFLLNELMTKSLTITRDQ